MEKTSSRFLIILAATLCLSFALSCSNSHQASSNDPTVPGAPGQPLLTAGDKALTVSWTAVATATGYEVYWHTVDSTAGIPLANTASTTALTATIGGLANDTAYHVWVKAKNAVGLGDFSLSAAGTPRGPFTEDHSILSSGSWAGFMVGALSPYNSGIGESITLAKAYAPQDFSVFIHSTQYFKYVSSGASVPVTLQLKVWDQSTGVVYGSATASVAARSTSGEEEVTFSFADALTIPAGTPAVYAVYLPAALADGIRGSLLYYASGTEQYSSGLLWRSNAATDATIVTKGGWMAETVSSYDLKFILVGVEK